MKLVLNVRILRTLLNLEKYLFKAELMNTLYANLNLNILSSLVLEVDSSVYYVLFSKLLIWEKII